MNQFISQISLIVKDYDEAINFYINKLGFELIEDTERSPEKRWVRIKPKGDGSVTLLFAKAKNEEQMAHVGNQTGNRVFLFLHTDDIERDYQKLLANNVTIIRPPGEADFGKALVFADLYGNLWDLIEPNTA